MPDINGLELINFVKKNPNYRRHAALHRHHRGARAGPGARPGARRRRVPGQALRAREPRGAAAPRTSQDRAEPAPAQGADRVHRRGARRSSTALASDLLALDEQRGQEPDPDLLNAHLPRRALAQGPRGDVRRRTASPRSPTPPRTCSTGCAWAASTLADAVLDALLEVARRLPGAARRGARGRRRAPELRRARARRWPQRLRGAGGAGGAAAAQDPLDAAGPRRPGARRAHRVRGAPAARERAQGRRAVPGARGLRPRGLRQGARRAQRAAQAAGRGDQHAALAPSRATAAASPSTCIFGAAARRGGELARGAREGAARPQLAGAARPARAPAAAAAGRARAGGARRPRRAAAERRRDERRAAAARRRGLAALAHPDGARRHPQARPADEHRRRAAARQGQPAAAGRGGAAGGRRTRSRSCAARSCTARAAQLERKLDELQKGILEVRMVPLGQVFDKLARLVRQHRARGRQGDRLRASPAARSSSTSSSSRSCPTR